MDFGQLAMLCCIVPLGLMLFIGFVAVKNFPRFAKLLIEWTEPDTTDLHKKFEVMKATYPNDSQQQLVKRIINQYAIRQGVVGALTSAGGVIVLPLGLSVDLAYSARSNAELSFFIAQVYGIQNETKTLNLGQLLVLQQRNVSPDELVMWQEQFAGAIYRQLAQSILQKTVAKIFPGIGILIGFAVDWSSAQVFGRVANTYYSGNLKALVNEGTGILTNATANVDREKLWKGFTNISSQIATSGISSISSITEKLQQQSYDPTADRIVQLQKLVELKEQGVLSDDEFETMKQAVMGGLAEQMDEVEDEVLMSEGQDVSEESNYLDDDIDAISKSFDD